MSSEQPTVLVVGATGQTGRPILADFDRDPGNVRLRLAARKQADLDKMRAAGKDAVYLDLDDPRTFGTALAGVDRLCLLTGYTVAMINCEIQPPEVLATMLAESGAMEKNYAEGAVEFMRQVIDGRMGYIGTARDDGPFVTGRASTTLRQWAIENRESLLRASGHHRS
jgi:NmrA-like family